MFAEQDKLVFGPFFDGVQQVYADPLHVRDELRFLLDDPNAVVAQAKATMPLSVSPEGVPSAEEVPNLPVRREAWRRLDEATVAAFGLRPFDPATGQGVTKRQIRALWNDFQAFCTKKKSPDESSPTSSTLSAGPPTAPSPAEKTPTTSIAA